MIPKERGCMAELARREPLEGVQPVAHARVNIAAAPPMARAIVRGAGGNAFGLELPTTPCRAVIQGDRAALWLGPDEWLVIAPELEETGGTIVDVSHRQIALIVEGPLAAAFINGACPLDLHLSTFPIGMCTRTVFAKAEIVLWRTGEQRFHLEVARSFGAYVHELLREIAGSL
jgi:sarcosine oxidase subunit gamma